MTNPPDLLRFAAATCLTVTCLLGGSVIAKSAVLVEYDADSAATAPDPMSPAGGSWVARRAYPSPNTPANAGTGTAAPPANRTSGSETINGRSYNYVTFNSVSSTAIGAVAYDFAGNPALEAGDPTGWTATATVRVEEATIAGGRAVNYLRVFANGREHYIAIFNDPDAGKQGVVFWESSYSTDSANANYYLNHLISYDVSSDYVTYQLYYDPDTLSTTLYINGVAIDTKAISTMSGAAGNIYSAGTNRAMEWGKATSSGSAEVYWNNVRFETGFAVIPEPSTFALAGAGLIGAALLRRRVRKG